MEKRGQASIITTVLLIVLVLVAVVIVWNVVKEIVSEKSVGIKSGFQNYLNLLFGNEEETEVLYASSVTQYGITWTFDKDYGCGQFANGDYWVVGPVNIVNINPMSTNISGRVMHGSQINPIPSVEAHKQGYDTHYYKNPPQYYDANLNVARPNGNDLSESNPLIVPAGSSLISSVSKSAPLVSPPQLQTAAILTVLDARPPADSFRPAYAGTDKTIKFNKADLANAYSLLGSISRAGLGEPSLSTVERYFERPWLDHNGPEEVSRYHHPESNMPNFGRDMAVQIGIGALMLQLDFTDEEKETLLIRMTQIGIDFYELAQNGRRWEGNGGHGSGRKWPILFAGLVLDNPNADGMKNIGEYAGDYLNPNYINFGEDDQTFYVTQADVDQHHDLDYAGSPYPDYSYPYVTDYRPEHLDMPEWGIRHGSFPPNGIRRDNVQWSTNYRWNQNGAAWPGFILAAQIMEETTSTKTLWNHNALFDYEDRFMAIQKGYGWSCGDYRRSWSCFVETMWDTYRADYGCVWQNISDCSCVDDEQQLCPKQLGVCVGSLDTCSGERWPGCDDIIYSAWNSNYENPETSCSDSYDNDCDGCINNADSDCGGIETNCNDELDNDCDALFDCDDSDCSSDEFCSANVWNCTSLGNFDDTNCWSLGHAPLTGENVRFDSTGTGNCDIKNNTMPQNLKSFTVKSDYTGIIYFKKEFAVGGVSGTQIWNVTNNIDILGGTMKIYGDADGTPTNGLGQEWRSMLGNIAIGSGAELDGIGLGFAALAGPGAGDSTHGGAHGGWGGGNNLNVYGSETQPTSLGSGGGNTAGGSAIKLESNDAIIDGTLDFMGVSGLSGKELGAGGSVWIKASNISGTGTIIASGGTGAITGRSGGGGRIALTSLNVIEFSGTINNLGGSGDIEKRGSGGTVYLNASTSIISSMAVSTTGYNGGNIKFKDTLLTLSGTYTATGTNADASIILDYTDCGSSFIGAVFNPTPIDLSGC